MFTNITENCVVSPSGSSPSSAVLLVIGTPTTADACGRPGPLREWRLAPVPSTALSRTNRAPAAVRFCVPLRSVPFRAVLSVCLTGLPAPHSCLRTLMADHCPSWYGTLSTLVMIRSVTSVSRIYHSLQSGPFGFPPTNLCPLERGLLLENLFSARVWRHPNVLALQVLRLRYWIVLLILECTFKLLTEPVFEILNEFQYLLSSLGPFCFKTPLLLLLK